MQPRELQEKLQGVIAFPVTPFTNDGSLDVDGLRRNLGSLLRHPISAVVAAGGTGEVHSLSPAEQEVVVRTTVEAAGGRVPVLAGVGLNLPIAVAMARAAAEAGAAGLLAFPPYYPNADEDGLIDYHRQIAESTALGLVIYTRDWFNPSPAMAGRLAGAVPTLVAWKDGQGDLRRYQMIRHHVGDRLRWIGGAGDDLVPGYYAMGVRAYTSSIANVAPRLSLRLHELAAAGRSDELAGLMNELVIPLYTLRARRRGYEVAVMKAMMDLVGLCGGPVRAPLVDAGVGEIESLRAMLGGWKQWL